MFVYNQNQKAFLSSNLFVSRSHFCYKIKRSKMIAACQPVPASKSKNQKQTKVNNTCFTGENKKHTKTTPVLINNEVSSLSQNGQFNFNWRTGGFPYFFSLKGYVPLNNRKLVLRLHYSESQTWSTNSPFSLFNEVILGRDAFSRVWKLGLLLRYD